MNFHKDIKACLETIQSGGLILYPTDTVWGIGCDANNPEAVKRVLQLKRSEGRKSMLVLVDSEARLNNYVPEVPDAAWDLLEFAVKPTTIIYDGARNVCPELIAEDGSLGVRVVKDEFCQNLIQRFKRAIVSTSANISGEPTPSSFVEISDEIKNHVDYVVEYGRENKGVSSTIIKLGAGAQVKIIRE